MLWRWIEWTGRLGSEFIESGLKRNRKWPVNADDRNISRGIRKMNFVWCMTPSRQYRPVLEICRNECEHDFKQSNRRDDDNNQPSDFSLEILRSIFRQNILSCCWPECGTAIVWNILIIFIKMSQSHRKTALLLRAFIKHAVHRCPENCVRRCHSTT